MCACTRFCLFLALFVCLSNTVAVKKDRPRRDLGQRSSEARGSGLLSTKHKRQESANYDVVHDPPREEVKPPGGSGGGNVKFNGTSSGNGGENTPLLDFPSWEIDNSPLLDFPDPLEEDWKRRSVSYEGSCHSNQSQSMKDKEARKAPKKYKVTAMHEVKTQSRQLEQAIMSHFITTAQIPDHQPINSWKLLDQTAEIFKTLCKDDKHLPKTFIPHAIYTFKKLHFLTTPDRTEYLSEINYKWITANLAECANNSKGVRFFQDQCHEDIVAWKKEKNWLCTRWSDDFNLGVYDPLLDVIWHIYNGVYYYCKDFFKDNYWQLHNYAAAIMDLFTTAIKLRWRHQIQSEAFWTRLLGPNFSAHARNVERCTQAGVESDELQVMKPRYISSSSLRYAMSEIDSLMTVTR